MNPWKRLASTVLVDGKYTRVRRDQVELPGGAVIPDYYVIEAPTWAGVIAITTQKELVLVRQYRYGHQDSSLELPAGVLEDGESILDGAARELREETGYHSEALSHLWSCRPEPARHEQWAHFTFAPDARSVAHQALDSTEEIRVELVPVAQLDAVLAEMVHGLHVAALLLAARKGLFD